MQTCTNCGRQFKHIKIHIAKTLAKGIDCSQLSTLAYMKKYYEEHKEKMLQQIKDAKQIRDPDGEQQAVSDQKYYQSHKEKYKLKYQNNKDKLKTYNQQSYLNRKEIKAILLILIDETQ